MELKFVVGVEMRNEPELNPSNEISLFSACCKNDVILFLANSKRDGKTSSTLIEWDKSMAIVECIKFCLILYLHYQHKVSRELKWHKAD